MTFGFSWRLWGATLAICLLATGLVGVSAHRDGATRSLAGAFRWLGSDPVNFLPALRAAPGDTPLILTVNTTGDNPDQTPGDGFCADASGACTLRAALEEATANQGPDTITFNIPGPGPHTIMPLSALPAITETLTIDGYTQPGAAPNTNPAPMGLNTQLQIDLDGSLAGAASGLFIHLPLGSFGEIDQVTIRGLAIHSFARTGIGIAADEEYTISNTHIEGNFLGTSPDGTLARGNSSGIEAGYFTFYTTIGGPNPQDRNLISGNTMYGIRLLSRFSETGSVQGNLIGTDITGQVALPNGAGGIQIDDAVESEIGGLSPNLKNVISGNGGPGISITGSPYGRVWIRGNFIGTDSSGSHPLPNAGSGVLNLFHELTSIGGQEENAGNTIAYNLGDGIEVVYLEGGVDIFQNSIRENTGLGIDFGEEGATAGLYPILTEVRQLATGAIAVTGYTGGSWVDLFANRTCDPSGFGEGELPLVTVAAAGPFTVHLEGVDGYPFITATDGGSEFSVCLTDPLILVDDLQGYLQQLVADGELAPEQGQRLAAYLRGVERALRADQPERAIAFLYRFDRAVRSLVRRSLLEETSGQVLLEASAEILQQIRLQQASQ